MLEAENQAFRLWGKHSNYQTAYQRPEGKQNNEIVANQRGGSRNFRKGGGGVRARYNSLDLGIVLIPLHIHVYPSFVGKSKNKTQTLPVEYINANA